MISLRSFAVVALFLLIPAVVSATEYFVDIPGFNFDPAELTIMEGDIVTWTNNHTFNHTSTSDDGSTWDSGIIPPGESFSHTFTAAGTYPYHCTIHLSMTGTITVNPADNVPTLSEWGMMIMSLLLIVVGTIAVIRRRSQPATEKARS